MITAVSTVSDMNVAAILPAIPEEPMFRLSVAQYHEMIEHGILTTDDRVELLDGYLVTKMSKKPRHSQVTQQSGDIIGQALPNGWFVNIQEPITLLESEPEPDISVIRGNRKQFRDQHPAAKDIGMLIETADTSLQRDRGSKKRIYAAAQIAIYWIINLIDDKIEVYSRPTVEDKRWDYRDSAEYRLEDSVPFVLDGMEVARVSVTELLS